MRIQYPIFLLSGSLLNWVLFVVKYGCILTPVTVSVLVLFMTKSCSNRMPVYNNKV